MSDPTPKREFRVQGSIGPTTLYQPDPRPELAFLCQQAGEAVPWLDLPSASARAEAWTRIHRIAERISRVWGWSPHAKIGPAVTGLATPDNWAWHEAVAEALNRLAEAAHALTVWGQGIRAGGEWPALPAAKAARFREAVSAFTRTLEAWPVPSAGAIAEGKALAGNQPGQRKGLWDFSIPGRFGYGGRYYPLKGISRELLKRFVSSPGSTLTVNQIEYLTPGRVSSSRAYGRISSLKNALCSLLQLPLGSNPITRADNGAYTLNVPPLGQIRPGEIEEKPKDG